jgi:hypothetical protein
LRYELAWRFGRWDWEGVFSEEPNSISRFSKNEYIWRGLRAVHRFFSSNSTTLFSRESIVSAEFTRALSKVSPILCATAAQFSVEALESIRFFDSKTVSVWRDRLESAKQSSGFAQLEDVIMWRIRLLLFRMRGRYDEYDEERRITEELFYCYNHYVKSAISANKPQLVMQLSAMLSGALCNGASTVEEATKRLFNMAITVASAKVLWQTGHHLSAIDILKSNIAPTDPASSESGALLSLNSEAFLLLGSWTGVTHSESPQMTVDCFFNRAISLLTTSFSASDRSTTLGHAYIALGNFCAEEYNRLSNSDLVEESERVLRMQEEELRLFDERIRGVKSATARKQLESLRRKATNQLQLDRNERNRRLSEHARFLQKATLCYLKALTTCDDLDMTSSKFCTLFFDYHSPEHDIVNADTGADDEMARLLETVATHKFVRLIYQLSAALSSLSLSRLRSSYGKQLFGLVLRIGQEHPYHRYITSTELF